MRLSVVILAHDQLVLTRACLQALAAALDGVDHEVLCIDNASEDELGRQLEAASEFRRFTLERNDQNFSFSIANNRAAARVTGDWVLFLNNDVALAPESLRAFRDFAQSHPDAGVCGGRLVYPGGRRLQHAGMEQMLWGFVSNYGVGAPVSDSRFRQDADRFAVTGAMLCIRREVFEAVGGFDEDYRWGYEDVDLCLKARHRGRRVVYVSRMEAVHHESATLREKRRPADRDHNYRLYRARWESLLEPAEASYLRRLTASGVRRAVVFGTGQAGRGLYHALTRAGIDVVAFTAFRREAGECEGRPVVPPDELGGLSYDRLAVGTQFFFEIEDQLKRLDPQGLPLFPVLPGGR